MKSENPVLTVLGRLIVYAYALFLLVPMFFIVMTALKSGAEVNSNPLGLPSKVMFSNFTDAFTQGKMAQYGLNSILVSVTSVTLALLNTILVTYGVYKLFYKKIGVIVYGIVIASMFLPGVGYVSMIALYQKLHLYNNLWGVILGAGVGGLAFNLFILLGFLRTVPKELEEASIIDGCNSMQSLFYVLLPVIKPALVTLGIFAFVSNWNSLLGPLLLLRNEKYFTIPIGLLNFKGTYSVQYNLMFAAIFIAGAPLIVLYLKFQKHFVEALAGSVKG